MKTETNNSTEAHDNSTIEHNASLPMPWRVVSKASVAVVVGRSQLAWLLKAFKKHVLTLTACKVHLYIITITTGLWQFNDTLKTCESDKSYTDKTNLLTTQK